MSKSNTTEQYESKIVTATKICELMTSIEDVTSNHVVSSAMIGFVMAIKYMFPEMRKSEIKLEISRMFDLYFDEIKIERDTIQ